MPWGCGGPELLQWEHWLGGLFPPACPRPRTSLGKRHARQAAQEPRLSRTARARAAPMATPRTGSSTRASSRPAWAAQTPQHPSTWPLHHAHPSAATCGQEGGSGDAHTVGCTDREVSSCAAEMDVKRAVGQPWVARGTQEEKLGGVGHHMPILVHPGDAGRWVGLHQHEEHQEKASALDLLVAGTFLQDLWLIWVKTEAVRWAGGMGATQLGAGFVSPGFRCACPPCLHRTDKMLPCCGCDGCGLWSCPSWMGAPHALPTSRSGAGRHRGPYTVH